MKEMTKDQLLQKMKEHKQETQLILVNDILEKIQHLANKTMKVDYEPSFEEAQKILQIKRLADAILKNIS
jgi:SET domain-containing protein